MKIKTDKGFKTETIVESKTLPKEVYPQMNRGQRRDAIYSNPVRRLIGKISDLRKEMISSGIEPLPFPKFKNRNVLSGHMSQLQAQVLA